MPSRRLLRAVVLSAVLAQAGGLRTADAAGHFLRVGPDAARFQALGGESGETVAARFLAAHADVLGLRDLTSELAPPVARKDAQGWRHLSYRQRYLGLPVFGGILRAHLDPG